MTKINVIFNNNHPNINEVLIDKDLVDISIDDVAKAVKCNKELIKGWTISSHPNIN